MQITVNEISHSIQGEGRLAGLPSVFVRLPGCPLRCSWCDTAYAWDENSGEKITLDLLTEKAASYSCPHLVITGGEPFTNPAFQNVLKALRPHFKHITVETAGIKHLPSLPIDLLSISPKLTSSLPKKPEHIESHKSLIENRQPLTELINNYNTQLKFVVDSKTDVLEVKELLEKLPRLTPDSIMLMPQAKTKEVYLKKCEPTVKLCIETGLSFSPRLHIQLWGSKKGV